VADYFRRQGSKEPARVIHRLDRGTSGVMVFPKHRQAAAWLSQRFHDGQAEKLYLALVSGQPPHNSWRVEGAIGKIGSARYGIVDQGKAAVTEFRLAGSSCCGYSLVEARPLTGRTHQIRVHLASCGLPIVGDATYGGEPGERMMLHCAALSFRNEKRVEIRIQAPPDGVFSAMMNEYGLDHFFLP
jgi:23S rRNA-/tRNA-specific pseudouridylate synthase